MPALAIDVHPVAPDPFACLEKAAGALPHLQEDPRTILNGEVAIPAFNARLEPGHPAEMEPEQVVAETMAALGRKPSFVPGVLNKLIAFLMSHLVPRRLAIRIIGDATGAMYLDKGTR